MVTTSGLLVALAALAPAQAQTSVRNTATVALPPGSTVVEADPNNNTSFVDVGVLALPSLTLVKQVVNDQGGTAVSSAWTLVATGGTTTISGSTGSAAVTSVAVPVGTYVLSETGGPAGYAAGTWSCVKNGGAAVSANSISLVGGDVATCTITNDDQAATLTLVKTVTNDNGGTATVADFPLTATGPTTITGVSGTAAVTNAPVSAGVYTLSEVTAAGYTAGAWSCTAGTQSGSQLTLANGQSATCTIVNDDQAATLTLVKTVTNDNGGTATVADFPLTATGPTTITGVSGTAVVTNAPVSAGVYTLSEVTAAGYTAGAWSCTAGTLSGSQLTLVNGQSATCTIVNDDQAARLTLVKTVTNDNGGTATVANFPLTATGPTTITGVSGTAAVTSRSVNAGVYTLSEVAAAGYTAGAWSCTAGTLSGSQLTLANGQSATCTIVNDDRPATLRLIKQVVNTGGGTAVATDWTLTATGPTVVSGPGGVGPVSVSAGVYTLSESSGPAGYVAGAGWDCVNDGLASTGNQVITVTNGGQVTCVITNTYVPPAVTYSKSATLPGSQTAVSVGDVITYTLTTVVANSQTTSVTTLTDTLGTGLDFVTVGTQTSTDPANTAPYVCNAANPLVCTLAAGTLPGTYTVTYTARVNAQAVGTVDNAVVGTNATCTTNCGTSTPVTAPAVTYSKSATLPGSQTAVSVGDVITYTLTTVVANSQTTSVTTLTDTLGTGLDFVTVGTQTSTDPANTAPYVCNAANPLVCTLAAGTLPGTYTVTYTARVNAQAVGTVDNAVVGTNATCTTNCGTSTPVTAPAVTYSKSVTLPSGQTEVSTGDTLTYTLTATIARSSTTAPLTLTDTLGVGLTLANVSAGNFTCGTSNPLVCTLSAGTAPGTYMLTYTATVNDQATGTVNNAVVGTGDDAPTCAGTCTTETPVTEPLAPLVTYAKSATLPSGQTELRVGDTVTYTLTATVVNAVTSSDLVLTDTLGTGLDFVAVTNAGA
ncbi:MAG: isopeptide-forming domain-containing fimbrial protein, partial [Proteobacteria bacterium]|nr:isopeptide-forming domain-containing fimbrial protein [Pseudomonadota bacterium]